MRRLTVEIAGYWESSVWEYIVREWRDLYGKKCRYGGILHSICKEWCEAAR